MSETVSFNIVSPHHDHFRVLIVDKMTGDTKEYRLTKSAPVTCEVKRNADGNGEIEMHPQIGQTVERLVQEGETVLI